MKHLSEVALTLKGCAIGALLFSCQSLCAQGFLIDKSSAPGYTPMPMGSVYTPCLECSAQDNWQLLQLRLQFEKEQREQAQANNQDANYYADLELMMEQLKYDRTFQTEISRTVSTNEFEQRLMADPVFRTQMGLVQDALKNYRNPNTGWTTITINGVSSTPGFEAYVHGSSSSSSGSGHISPDKLNRQADREARSYQAYKNNPTASSYLFWKSNQKLTQTYQRYMKR